MSEQDSEERPMREKSVIEPEDYAGLQLDTRLPHDGSESDAPEAVPFEVLPSPTDAETLYSPTDRPLSGEAPMTVIKEHPDKEALGPPRALAPGREASVEEEAVESKPVSERSCGPWKARYIFLWSVPVALAVILAIVLGAVLGSRNVSASTTSSPPTSTLVQTSAPSATSQAAEASASAVNSNLPGNYVMVGSSLASVANSSGASGYNLFFQAANGHAKFSWSDQLNDSWVPANAVFTDAVNGTGLAGISYHNGTLFQTSIYYVTSDLKLYEKRDNGSGYFYPGTLGAMPPLQLSGNFSLLGEGGWNGYRITAVYSANFSSGAGARLFVPQSNDTSSWVQELVWTQSNDSWAYGTRIKGPTTESHLSAIIEPQSQTLRLFYSMPDHSIQELWCNITSPDPVYQPGVKIPSLLLHPSADFSAISTAESTFIYYSSTLSPNANVTINELAVPLLPDTTVETDSPVIVTEPSLQATDTNGKNASVFVPLSAIYSPMNDAISVFFTSDAADPRGGYGALSSVYRLTDEPWGKDSVSQHMASIPLGYAD